MQEIQETRVRSLGQEDPQKEEMTTYSNILAWEMDKGAWHATAHEVTRVGHNLATKQQDSIYYTIENTCTHSRLLY